MHESTVARGLICQSDSYTCAKSICFRVKNLENDISLFYGLEPKHLCTVFDFMNLKILHLALIFPDFLSDFR